MEEDVRRRHPHDHAVDAQGAGIRGQVDAPGAIHAGPPGGAPPGVLHHPQPEAREPRVRPPIAVAEGGLGVHGVRERVVEARYEHELRRRVGIELVHIGE